MQPDIPIQKPRRVDNSLSGQFNIERWGKISEAYDFSKPHRHSYFEVLLFFRGTGFHEIDFMRYPVQSQSLHFVAAHSVHLLKRSQDSDGATILFSEEFFSGDQSLSRFLKSISIFSGNHGHVLKPSQAAFKAFKNIFLDMEQTLQNQEKESGMELKSLLTLLLARAENLFNRLNPEIRTNKVQHPVVEKYLGLVEENFLNHLSVREYASALHLTAKHLNELCKQYLSLHAQKVIHNRLLLEIKRMLVHSDLPVKEICYQTGFSDPAHFNHFFRFYMKLTPLQYRKGFR